MSWIAKFRRKLIARVTPDSQIVMRQYKERTGYPLDLKNPLGLHEKLCWLRLYRTTPLHSFCTDKVTAAAYIESRIGLGYLPHRYLVTRDPQQLRPEAIPSPSCVIKTNHDSGTVFLLEDTATADWPAIREKVAKRMKRNHYDAARERQYKPIVPAILVEELLPGTIWEVKMFCLNGRVAVINSILCGLQSDDSPREVVDPDWNHLDVNRMNVSFTPGRSDPPPHLAEMKAMAERLAEPFSFVRVDFMLSGDRFVLGELTFSPTACYENFTPRSFELELGRKLDHRAPAPDWRPYLAAAQAQLIKAPQGGLISAGKPVHS